MLFNGDLKMVPVSYTLSSRGPTSGKSWVSAPWAYPNPPPYLTPCSQFLIIKLWMDCIDNLWLTRIPCNIHLQKITSDEFHLIESFYFCLLEAGDIVTLPMKSVSLFVAYSSKLFQKMFHAPALPRCFR